MPSATHHVGGLTKAIGAPKAFEVLGRRMFRMGGVVSAQLRGAATMIQIDPLDSDLFVASQVFGHKEYSLSDDVTDRLRARAREIKAGGNTPVIVDGGANVGYSALHFADTFVDSLVVALEPVDSTFEVLQRNCSQNPRILPIRAALWSHSDGVRMESPGNGSWAHHVGEEGELTPSVTLHGLFADHPDWIPLIIKLDIEGGEKTVAAASQSIFQVAACIMVEPHDFKFPGGACLAPLYKALADRPMDTLLSGENLVLIDPQLTAA